MKTVHKGDTQLMTNLSSLSSSAPPHGSLFLRPAVSGAVLDYLSRWIRHTLSCDPTAVGEEVTDLYRAYRASCSCSPCVGQTKGKKDWKGCLVEGTCLPFVSRKQFTAALLFLLKKTGEADYISHSPGRRAYISGVVLKSNPCAPETLFSKAPPFFDNEKDEGAVIKE